MTGQSPEMPGGPGPMTVVEDPEIAALVRDAAATWTMPPRPIGEDTWRERARSGGRRRVLRVLVSAVAAVVAVAVASVGAAVLLSPPGPDVAGPSAIPSHTSVGPSATPGATADPGRPAPSPPSTVPATPLPVYGAFGALPADLTVAGLAEDGWRVTDMATGASSDPIAASPVSGSRIFALADGTYLCACTAFSGDDRSGRVEVVVRRYGVDGSPGAVVARLVYAGTSLGSVADVGADPVGIDATLSPDGTTLAIGWSAIDGTVWHAGVDTVDLEAGAVSRGAELPIVPAMLDASVDLPARWDAYADTGRPLVAWPPTAWISTDGERMVLRRALSTAGAPVRVDWWASDAPGGGSAAGADPLGGSSAADGAPCVQGDAGYAGWTAPAVFSIVCATPTRADLLRFDAAGIALGAVDLAAESAGAVWPLTGPAVAEPRSGTLYLWDPYASRLAAIDTIAGTVARSETIAWAPAGATDDPIGSLLRGLARALVPGTAAKVLLDPAMALSPDGRTVYLLGTTATSIEATDARSTGIAVVDAATLAVRARWAPPADLSSIVVSADGRYVVAAGAPGVDASGAPAPWEASLAAWDVASGRLVAVAGRLGGSWIELAQPQHGDRGD